MSNSCKQLTVDWSWYYIAKHYHHTIMNPLATLSPLMTWLSSIRHDGIDFLYHNALLTIVGYILIVVILLIRWIYSNRVLIHAQYINNHMIDTIRYELSRLLYRNKSEIYDFQSTIALLLHHKTQVFSQQIPPYEASEQLIKEAQYIRELLHDESPVSRENLRQNSQIVRQISYNKKKISWLLAMITLGISRFFISK